MVTSKEEEENNSNLRLYREKCPTIDAKPCAYADILRTFPIVCVFIINSQSIQRLLSRPIFFIVYDGWMRQQQQHNRTIQSAFNDTFFSLCPSLLAALLLHQKVDAERRAKTKEWTQKKKRLNLQTIIWFCFNKTRTHGYNNTTNENKSTHFRAEPSTMAHSQRRRRRSQSLSFSSPLFFRRLQWTNNSTTIRSWCIYLNCFWSLSVRFWDIVRIEFMLIQSLASLFCIYSFDCKTIV